jgi:hypothetical protein
MLFFLKKLKMKNKSWIQIAVFLFFIVIIPLGSYYYLKRGYDYRKEALESMQDLGPLPESVFTTVDGRTILADSLQGHLVIANAFSLQYADQSRQFGELMVKLNDQFEETGRLVLLSFGTNPEYDVPEAIRAFAKEYDLLNKPRVYWIPADSSGMGQVIDQLYFPETDAEGYPFFALCDTSRIVQNHYSIDDMAAIREMVTFTAMFLPQKPRKKVVFEREIEK